MSLHQVIPETERLAYLEALGVSSWLPLEDQLDSYGAFFTAEPVADNELDSQAPSKLLETTIGGDVEASSQPTVESQVVPAPQYFDEPPPLGMSVAQVQEQAQQMRADLVADVSQTIADEPAVATVVTEPEPAPVVVEKVAPLHLSMSWYQAGVLVINELPLQDGAAMSSSLAQLQTAMVNALGLGQKEVMPQTQGEFFWPLVPGPHGDSSKAGGTDALAYQMRKLLQDKVVRCVLLLGQRSLDLLGDVDLAFGETASLSMWPEAQALHTHSLHQLLKIPANKAEAWRHMQPLLAANN